MKKKLYLECYAGISGDMTVGALLDLGANEKKLRRTLDSLHLDGYAVGVKRVQKSGLDVCDFAVLPDAAYENHDHDMEYLHGRGAVSDEPQAHGEPDRTHTHTHPQKSHVQENHGCGTHEQDHTNTHSMESCVQEDHGGGMHERPHTHTHAHTHEHVHRGLPEILKIIQSSAMTDRAKATAIRIFDILARAEAKAHGVPPEQVHFHEVGAVDSIVDIAAAAICLDDLDIEDVIVPVLCEGSGTVRCQHGILPIPVPATLNIVSEHHLRLHRMDVEGEFVTPTGAAIAAAIRTEDRLPECFRVERIGMGAGKRAYERPSILRAMLIVPEEDTDARSFCLDIKPDGQSAASFVPEENQASVPERDIDAGDIILKLESNIDDCSGEAIAYAMERLFAAGARDVHYTPVYMKKNRPAYMLTVLCEPEQRETMEKILFAETTTIGIRRQRMERTVLKRENRRVPTPLGEIDVKVLEFDGHKRYAPEYESVAVLAGEKQISFLKAYQIAEEAAGKFFSG
ncbi:MAG: nickel pincer cofactor biosynthesis protein LarC [Lachnospiraceae bacterium]|nr:nickel pincer cofactor biosynthesis protein LarC [Lachnospiraceae bacterium]